MSALLIPRMIGIVFVQLVDGCRATCDSLSGQGFARGQSWHLVQRPHLSTTVNSELLSKKRTRMAVSSMCNTAPITILARRPEYNTSKRNRLMQASFYWAFWCACHLGHVLIRKSILTLPRGLFTEDRGILGSVSRLHPATSSPSSHQPQPANICPAPPVAKSRVIFWRALCHFQL